MKFFNEVREFSGPVDTTILNGRRLIIGIGAMKAGTSWLSDHLSRHPEIFFSPIKEMNFFNTIVKNPLQNRGGKFRRTQIEEMLLDKWRKYPPSQRDYRRLQDLFELEHLNRNVEAYKTYFARRIGREQLFGEFCPQYSLLPSSGFRRMAAMGFDLRLIFIMRDPADRIVSQLHHARQRNNPTLVVDDLVEKLKPGNLYYDRSDYGRTLDAVQAVEPSIPFLPIFYEKLYTEAAIETVHAFFGVSYQRPNFGRVINPSKGKFVSREQRAAIRSKLEPIYADMRARFGSELPPGWHV